MNIFDFIFKLENLYVSYGYLIVFLASFIEVSPLGWLVPGGILLAIGGFFAFGNQTSLLIILVFGWLGAWSTFLLAYFLGRQTGFRLVNKLKQEKNAAFAKLLFKKHGVVILTASMLSNLTRFWVAYAAGSQRYSPIKFLFYSTTASLAWSSLFIIVGYFTGSERAKLESIISNLGVAVWILFFLVLIVIYIKIKNDIKIFIKGDKL